LTGIVFNWGRFMLEPERNMMKVFNGDGLK